MIFVSATPGPYELEQTGGEVVEQVIRPTGLLDPVIEVVAGPRPGAAFARADPRAGGGGRAGAGHDAHQAAGRGSGRLLQRARACAASGCTASWTPSSAWSCCAICGKGKFEALVGVNLLREGLDLPEVSLVAILDADKEGFLRSETSLMQTIGRAARNVNAKVILYADRVTDSMQRTIDETARRRDAARGVQPRARHHAGDDQEGDLRGHRSRRRRPMPRRTPRSAAPTRRSTSPRNTSPSWKPRCSPRPRRWNSSGRPSIRDRIEQMRESDGQAGGRGAGAGVARPQAAREEEEDGRSGRSGKAACRGRSGMCDGAAPGDCARRGKLVQRGEGIAAFLRNLVDGLYDVTIFTLGCPSARYRARRALFGFCQP